MANTTTMKEIARLLNISVSSVSRALAGHHSIGLKTTLDVKRLAEELNYEPNKTAIFFQQKKTFTIGAIVPELTETFFSLAISGIEDTANKKNYTVLLGQSHDCMEKEKQVIEKMKDHRVDGIVMSIAKGTSSYDHLEMLKKYKIPVVFFDRIPLLDDIDYVTSDIETGTAEMISYLVASGHKRIAMINGPKDFYISNKRLSGFKKGHEENNMAYYANQMIFTELTPEDTHKAMHKLLQQKKRPDAVITFNDYVTFDAVHVARKYGLEINKDIFFVSYANLPVNKYTAFPPVASLEQYPYKQASMATDILLEKINKPDIDFPTQNTRINLPTKLVVNDTVMLHAE